MKARHFVYDLVEDGNTIKKPNVNVILTDYVKGLGYKGDLVSVRPNFGHDKLLMPGLAVYDTPENRKKYDTEARLLEERRSPYIERTIGVFGRMLIAVRMNKFKPWVVEPCHIRASMRQAGLYVLDDSQIELPKTPITGPDPAKNNKDFYVTITINKIEKARVRCRLQHVTLDPKKRDLEIPEWWKLDGELLFPDKEGQKPIESDGTVSENNPQNPPNN